MAKSLQFKFRNQSYLITFKMGFFLLCLGFFCLFCLLGTWQLHRYAYKKTLLSTYQERLTAKPTQLGKDEVGQFQPVSVQGQYLGELTMLVQNKFHNDQLGFEVLTPVKVDGTEKLLLVDRGWVGSIKSSLTPLFQKGKLSGYIKILDEHQFILGKNILQPNASPLVMQKIDIDEISRITQHAFYPFILRLNPTEPNGFARDWVITSVIPQRHLGYAVQWFAMAFVLLIAFFCFCCERVETYVK